MGKFKDIILPKLKNEYRLIIYNDSTLHEVANFKLTRLNVFAYVGTFLILITVIISVLFVFTPLNTFLPAYTDSKLKRQIVENTLKVDSLEREIIIRNDYFENIKNVLQGKQFNKYSTDADTSKKVGDIDFSKSKHDSILRKQIEQEELENLSVVSDKDEKLNFKNMQFFIPVKGIVTNKFNVQENHPGIDIVAGPEEPILAIARGTVIMSTWSLATGYSIVIQHDDNLLSVYKHNSVLLKKEGDQVSAGESIAIIGNSGELTTGPHLHFEMWLNGVALNPEMYLTF